MISGQVFTNLDLGACRLNIGPVNSVPVTQAVNEDLVRSTHPTFSW